MKSLVYTRTEQLKAWAEQLDFFFCGVSKAEFLENQAPLLENWLKNGYHGKMGYMENHFDKRLDPTKLVEGAKSVVSLLLNYYPSESEQKLSSESNNHRVSKYAYGEDYHSVIKDKLKDLLRNIQSEWGAINGRVFVDSAPVMDKVWAEKSGLGWIGKNSNLLHPQKGSFFFIAELILDVELIPDGPIRDYCGTCTRCLDACPTEAIVKPYVVDGSRCISYLTIELKDAIPDQFKGKMENWVFGCDICQDVCPWNRFSKPHQEPRFQPKQEFLEMTDRDWKEMTEETFRAVFSKSAIKRTNYAGIQRNIRFVQKDL